MTISQENPEKPSQFPSIFKTLGSYKKNSHTYYIWWILHPSAFLSTECKPTSASNEEIHGEARGCNISNKIIWWLYFFQQHIFLSNFAAVLGFTLDRRLQSPATSSQVHLSFWHIFESLSYPYPFLVYSRQSGKYKSFK